MKQLIYNNMKGKVSRISSFDRHQRIIYNWTHDIKLVATIISNLKGYEEGDSCSQVQIVE